MIRRGLLPWRQALLLVAATLTGTLLVAAPATLAQWGDYRRPRLVLLGAGGALSALVVAGEARLLIATGDDPVAFGNALAQVQPWAARRIDIALVAGSGNDLNVPAALAADPHVRMVVAIGPPGDAPAAAALGGAAVLTTPRRFRLPEAVSVTVEPLPPETGNGEDEAWTWRATIERGETRLLIVSDGGAVAGGPPEPIAALVVAGDDPLVALGEVEAAALVVGDEAASGDELRSIAPLVDDPPAWGRRVFPGETLALDFVAGGLALPAEGTLPLAATPARNAPTDQAP